MLDYIFNVREELLPSVLGDLNLSLCSTSFKPLAHLLVLLSSNPIQGRYLQSSQSNGGLRLSTSQVWWNSTST